MYVEFIDYEIEGVINNHGQGYHGGSISPWMESLPTSKARIGFVRDAEPVQPAPPDDGYDDVDIGDPSWMLI